MNEEGKDNGSVWDSSGGVWEKKGLTCYESDAECIIMSRRIYQ